MNTEMNELGHLEMVKEAQEARMNLTTERTEITETERRVARERREKRTRRWEALGIEEVEAWPAEVEGAGLLTEVRDVLARHVVLPKGAAEALALWVVHTYAFELRDVTTYVGIASPEKRCGKTTLLEVLGMLTNRALSAANISPPALFRAIEEARPTLLIDEADTFLHGNDEMRGILNSGYTRKLAYVVRVASEIKNWELKIQNAGGERRDPDGSGLGSASISVGLRRFSCWCPKAMAAIGKLPETLLDRCVVITMQRKGPREKVLRLRDLDAEPLRRKCVRFVRDHAEAIATIRPPAPVELNDRAADIWEPLLAVADIAGGDWPRLARGAAVGLTAQGREANPVGGLLLEILMYFEANKTDRAFSRDLVAFLNEGLDRPWAEGRKGKEIDEVWLARQLKPYGVGSRSIWIKNVPAKGYFYEDLEPLFSGYISLGEMDALREFVRPEEVGAANVG